MKFQNKRSSDKGFSLVELLIAVVILGIIVAPLLNAFFVSAKTNAKAKTTQMATSTAQNIMEGLKANTLETVAYQCNYPGKSFNIIDSDMKSDAFEMLAGTNIQGATVYQKALSGEQSVKLRPNGTDFDFVGKVSGKYSFGLKNVTTQGTAFDTLIQYDSTKYRGANGYNSVQTANIDKIDTYQDAVYVQDKSLDSYALTEMKNANPTHIFSKSFLARTITVNITNSKLLSGDKTKAVATYTYSYNEGAFSASYSEDHVIFDNSESLEPLRAVYLFYAPLYDCAVGGDNIIINNLNNLDIDMFVIKQECVDSSQLNFKESNYKMKLKVNENTAINIPQGHLTLKTNLDKNLYSSYSPSAVNVTQAEYWYNGAVGSNIKNILRVNNLAGTGVIDTFYDVSVSIYSQGALKNNFPESAKLITITGTKLN